MAIGGLLLTGGASRRLGRPKHELARDGEGLAARGARVLREVCETVIEVGPGVSELPAVHEDPVGGGPLVSVVTGRDALRAAGPDGPVLVLAVDLPLIEAPLLRWLAAHPARSSVVPRVDGQAQPLCARYSATALATAAALVGQGARAMHALLDAVDVTYVDEADWSHVCGAHVLDDVDTPEDLDRLSAYGVGMVDDPR